MAQHPKEVPEQPVERWWIQKEIESNFDSKLASVIGPKTEPIEVVPALVAERLAEALREIAHPDPDEAAFLDWNAAEEIALAALEAYSGDST